ncbi:hypothetical protein [Companilactobacillus kimchii]|uniref:hypothetical protein n=1 Tax=Companilactobacillus kimchii TaxID=2801452 RepID=UPI00117BB6C6|nr:hypothetical protein [Companilactobacillus kimchii]
MNNMFAYIEIINNQSKSEFSYVNFEIKDNLLSIKPLKGILPADKIKIPLDQITDINSDDYYGWDKIEFIFNHQKYIFLYSGYGEYDYLKEHLISAIMA